MKDSTLREYAERQPQLTLQGRTILSLLDRIEKLRAALRFNSGTDWAVIAEEALAVDDKAQSP